ncbi:transmembrane protein 71 [Megalops cyprinoides]|uniref:transmembrane protein 71 n=1 Tax=Megalops cyprinoides TaxID=118141 RepID=UPI001863FB87|nr:transmembrane protein 71 [Megalops cyprinoides]XP_036375035.1 transmembrane protein 71 [Megalops cyprinoides]
MALLFSGAVTSSPIRKMEPLADQSCHSLGVSLLSSDLSYECYSVNPLTGSPCSCRRSPRLLSNGYYVLTEDSFMFDDEGNLSLTPSKTNVSYKERLVRIFRRRRKPRRSLASLFNMSETCQSWLDRSVFGGVRHCPLAESSWAEDSMTELSTPCDFTYDPSPPVTPPHKSAEKRWVQEEVCTEACFSQEQFSQSLGGFLDVPPPSPFLAQTCCLQKPQPAESAIVRAIFFIILTVCLFTAVFSRCLVGGLAVASITLTLILTSVFLAKSSFRTTGRWRKAKTEDITSRNE